MQDQAQIFPIDVEESDDLSTTSNPTTLSGSTSLSVQDTVSMTAQELELLQRTATQYKSIVVPTLRSLLPLAALEMPLHNGPKALASLKIYEQEYLKLLCFSAANNFAALEKFPIENIWQYLRTKISLPELLRIASGHTANALAENLFTSALCGKDVKSVKYLLENGYIDVNEHICTLESYRKFTPVELSSFLQDCSMTKLLLRFRADVNKTANTTEYGSRGALECAILRDNPIHKPESSDPELVDTLLGFGASVTLNCLQASLKLGDSLVVEKLIQMGARDNHGKWKESGIFPRAIQISSVEVSTKIVNFMLAVGADLDRNSKMRYSDDDSYGLTILDVAAKQGYMEVVRTLLSSGA